MNAPYAVTTVMMNENIKKIVEPKKRKYKFVSYFFCAAIAGSVASFVTCPLDIIKTKLQTQASSSPCEKLESKIESKAQKLVKDKEKASNLNKINAQIPYSTNSKPDCSTTEPKIKYKDISSTIKYIYRENGFIKGFFKGLTPRVMSNSPACAISWGTYEVIKHILSPKDK